MGPMEPPGAERTSLMDSTPADRLSPFSTGDPVTRRFVCVAMAIVILTTGAMVAHGQCLPRPGFNRPGVTAPVQRVFTYEYGNKRELWISGQFDAVGATYAHRIARFNSLTWRDGGVWAHTHGDDGVFGTFDNGTETTFYLGTYDSLLRWDRVAWSPVPEFAGSYVRAFTVFDDGTGAKLCVGGDIGSLGGALAGNVVCGDGVTWNALSGPLGTGLNGRVLALATYDNGSGPRLYAGGEFTEAGGHTALGIASWNGTDWSPVSTPWGNGVQGAVGILKVYPEGAGSQLMVGGDFEVSLGGSAASDLVAWDGTEWSELGSGVNGPVNALLEADGLLYVGGIFSQAGATSAQNIAVWNQSTWAAVGGGGEFGQQVNSLELYDFGSGYQIVAGGNILRTETGFAGHLVRWDGNVWKPVVTGLGLDEHASVREMLRVKDGPAAGLYFAGSFREAGTQRIRGVAKLDDQGWHSLGQGVDGDTEALVEWDDGRGSALYVGGQFDTAGESVVNNVARWDGSTWEAMAGPSGIGLNAPPTDMVVYNDGFAEALYVAGQFDSAGGVPVNSIARWDGVGWSAVSGPSGNGVEGGDVFALAVFDDGGGPELYASGRFHTAGGLPAQGIAKWDGAMWHVIPGVVQPNGGTILRLVVHDDGSGMALYATGFFVVIGGVSSSFAKWDGVSWSPAADGVPGYGGAIHSYSPARGESVLYAQSPSSSVAGWDGTNWADFRVDVWPYIWSLFGDTTFAGHTLYIGGHFAVGFGSRRSHILPMDCFETVFADGFESGDLGAWAVP